MASKTRGIRKSYALLIIIIMILGVVAGAFYFYHPGDCGSPPGQPTYTKGPTTFVTFPTGDRPFDTYNATFTDQQQAFAFDNVSFTTLYFSDPSKPHLTNNVCTTNSSTPGQIVVGIIFKSPSPYLPQQLTIQFNDPPLTTQQSQFTTNTDPVAGVGWQPHEPYFILLVSTG